MRNILNFILLISLSACGGGTSTGNPIKVTVQSASFSTSSVASQNSRQGKNFDLKNNNVEFNICVSDIIFENASEERIAVAFDNLGLISISDSTNTTTWGKVYVDEGKEFEFDTIIILADNNPELCGVDYSLLYEGNEIGQPFELFFEFKSQSFKTSDGDVYRLDLDTIITATENALLNGQFNDSEWADYIDDFVEDFEEDDDFFDDEGQFGD